MNEKYIPREFEKVLDKAVGQFPALVITGPRQSGKTTLLNHVYGKTYHYVSLDNPQTRILAVSDPELFLEKNAPPVIIDEIQYAPELLPYFKIYIDKHRQKKGAFLLTGSQQFPLMQGVTESLAGRTAVLTLLPMSWQERLRHKKPDHFTARYWIEGWIRGSFPELVANEAIDHQLWYSGYLQTYLERDVRALRQIGDLGEFQTFLQAAAARGAQLLNLSELSRDLGVAVNTVKAWIRILEASCQIHLLRPYYKNKGKRLVKSPKMFFTDTGLFSYLIGLREAEYALSGPSSGALMELAVFGEILRAFANQGKVPSVYFWRTAKGDEIDFIVETGQKLIPIEVKITKTPVASLARNLDEFQTAFAKETEKGYLVCLSETDIFPLSEKTTAVSFHWFVKNIDSLIGV